MAVGAWLCVAQDLVRSGQLVVVQWGDTSHHASAPNATSTWLDNYLLQVRRGSLPVALG